MDIQKIDAINSLQFVDWSCSGGECEYVLIIDTPENRQVLLNAGFTNEQFSDENVKFDPDDDILDVSYLAFNYAGASWFNPKQRAFGEAGESA